MKNKTVRMSSIKATLLTLGLTFSAISTHVAADAILHAFNWTYDDVAAKAAEIKALGYKKVLVSPAYKSTGNEWWARYQPQDYRVIDNPLGDTTDFQQMVTALTNQGVEVYADIVFNHMANETWKREDLNYPGTDILNEYSNDPTISSKVLFGNVNNNFLGAGDFHPEGCITDWNNPGHVQYWRLCGGSGDRGLPDLDPNSWVVTQQQTYLQKLKDYGVTGFRIDAAKHMDNYHINTVFNNTIKNGVHVFGEIITSGGAGNSEYDNFLAPYLNNTGHSAYDFPLFAQMRNAFGYGGSLSQLVDPAAYGQALDGSKAITFSVTHDIPLNDGFRYQILSPTDEFLANTYIFGRNGGVPMVYSDHNESGDNRWVNMYKQNNIVAQLKFHNAMQGRGMQVISYSDCHILFKRDHAGVVGINKCSNGQDVWVNTATDNLYWYRNYVDTLTGDTQYISSQWHKFYLPPQGARMWVME